MRCLVIGGTGFVGSEVTAFLLEHGHDVATVSRRGAQTRGGAESIRADRKDGAAFAAAIGAREFDLVVDLCGYQVQDLDAVLPALRGRIGHYVFISTDFVYTTDIERVPI